MTTQVEQKITPFKRLVAALTISNSAAFLALMTPILVLLTLKLTAIDPKHVTTSLSLVTGIGAFFALIFNPIAGFISDRTRFKFGRRRTWILLGLIFGGFALIGIGLSKEVWQVVLFWCCAQGLYNFALSGNTALIADQVEETKRGTISGVLGMTPNVTILLGMSLMTAMSKESDMSKWVLLAVIGVICSIVVVSMLRDPKHLSQNKAEKSRQKFSIWNVIPNPKKHPAFAWAWLSRFLVIFGSAATNYNAVFISQRFHIGPEQLSGKLLILTFASTVTLVLASLICGALSDRLKKQKPFVFVSGVLMAIGLILMAFSPNFNQLILANGLFGLGSGIYWAVDVALVTRVLPSNETAAKDLGIINIANALPQSIVPAIAPALLAIGGYTFMFSFIGIVAILGGLAILPVPELGKEKKADQDRKLKIS